MKKVMIFLISILLFMIAFFAADILKQFKFNQFLYQDRSAVVFNFNDYEGNPNAFMEDLAEKHNITISKYVFTDSKKIQVFSTDTTLGSRVSLIEGSLPRKDTDEFISSGITSSNLQTGRFDSGDSKIRISVFWLSNQNQSSPSGIYYFDTEDEVLINKIINFAKGYKISTEVVDINVQPVIEWPLITIISPLILLLSLLGTVAFYYTHKTNDIMIMKLYGYTCRKIISSQLKDIIPTLLLSSFIGFVLFISIELLIENRLLNFIEIILIYIGIFLILSIIFICYVSILINIIFNFVKEHEAIKGKRPYGLLMVMSLFMKIFFLVLTLIVSIQLHDTKVALDNYQDDLTLWNKTEGLYKTTLFYTGQVSRSIENEQNQNLQKVYNDLSSQEQGFVIDTSNYEETSQGGALYELNTEGGNSLTSPYGRAITINKNYLSYNPIQSKEGSIEDQWIDDDSVLNILVPASLKNYEVEITANFLDYFHFQKIEVQNIYNEAMGKALNKTPKEQLDINIIYVRNGQSYFTFEPSNKGEGNYYINDPIVIIDNSQFDSSYYKSYLSQFFYFYSDEINPMQTIGLVTERYNTSSQIQSLESVYDQYGDIIQKLVKSQYALLVAMFALSIAAITISLYFTICYVHKNKLMLLIKNVYGYGFLKRSRRILILHLTILIPLVVCAMVLNVGTMKPVIFSIATLDFIFILLFTYYLTNNAHVRMKKEM